MSRTVIVLIACFLSAACSQRQLVREFVPAHFERQTPSGILVPERKYWDESPPALHEQGVAHLRYDGVYCRTSSTGGSENVSTIRFLSDGRCLIQAIRLDPASTTEASIRTRLSAQPPFYAGRWVVIGDDRVAMKCYVASPDGYIFLSTTCELSDAGRIFTETARWDEIYDKHWMDIPDKHTFFFVAVPGLPIYQETW